MKKYRCIEATSLICLWACWRCPHSSRSSYPTLLSWSHSWASLGAALILVVPSLIGRRVLSDKDCAKGERGAMRLVAAFGVLVGLFGTTVTVLETYTDLLS